MLSKDPIKAAEQRKHISTARQKLSSDPHWIESQRKARLKLWQDPTYRESCISNMKIAIENPMVKDKLISSLKKAHEHPIKHENYKNGYKKRSLNPNMTSDSANDKRSIAQRGDKCHLWRGGVSFYPYCIKFNNKRKKAVRQFFDNTCLCCGKHKDENVFRVKGGQVRPIELDVHHIDHDKEQGCNGKEFNLIPLCRECHLDEKHNEQSYKQYINKTLDSGFAWGIWSEKNYIADVMYSD